MASSTNVATSLNVISALAATSGALQQTLTALANCHGGRSGQWLDDLEAAIMRSIKNMSFTGTSMDAETAAVDAALANVERVFGNVRKSLKPPARRFRITVTVQPARTHQQHSP